MGDLGKSPDASNHASNTAAAIAMDDYNQGLAVAQPMWPTLIGAASGDFDPTGTPQYNAGRQSLEDQYNVAQGNIMATMPSGGQLYERLGDLESNRANALGNLSAGISQDVWNQAFQAATGQGSGSASTLGQIGANQAQIEQAQSQQTTGLLQTLAMATALGK